MHRLRRVTSRPAIKLASPSRQLSKPFNAAQVGFEGDNLGRQPPPRPARKFHDALHGAEYGFAT